MIWGLFIWQTIPLEKQKSLLIDTRDPKISYGFGGHCNLSTLTGLCLFCNSNQMKLVFRCLWWTSFPICFLAFTKICVIISLSNKYLNKMTWNAGMSLRNLPKTACATLESFKCKIKLPNMIRLKLITATWMLCQHNINVITMYCTNR